MPATKAYMERRNKEVDIMQKNICVYYGLKVPGSRWETPPTVIESEQVKILWDLQMLFLPSLGSLPELVHHCLLKVKRKKKTTIFGL